MNENLISEVKMKPIYIFATRLRAFWVLLPMILTLYCSIIYNSDSTLAMKLYPLIIFSSACIVFTFVYLFRAIEISYSEIRYIGYFSSRDSAEIVAGRTLTLELMKGGKVAIRLYGKEGYNPDIKWLESDDADASDICVFRGKAYIGCIAVERILTYFGVENADVDTFIEADTAEKTYEAVTVSSYTENDNRLIKIRIDKTV